MMRSKIFILWVCLLWCTVAVAQERLLQAGPMVGAGDMKEVKLWVQTKEPAKVKIRYWEQGSNSKKGAFTPEVRTEAENAHAAHLVANQVEPGKKYNYELYINNKLVKRPYTLEFQTQELWQHRKDAPDFSFAIGSCFYVNDTPYDRPGKPYGGGYEILSTIHAKKPDFMVWLGDNTYLREPDWNTVTGIQYRYTHTRSLPELQPLLGSTHNYAMWDDHDFGPNNADRSFWMKDATLDAFKIFWANPNYIFEDAGITSTFVWNDVQFFMMDDRYFKSPNGRPDATAYLGDAQIQWLIDALHYSPATFKLICVGGQVLNPAEEKENYSNHPQELKKLLDAIQKSNIKGVIFFSGDRHFSELTKLERAGTYPLYDFTVSPLTAGPSDPRDEPNTLRVPGTLYTDRNFGLVNVSGPKNDRRLKVTILDTAGKEIWNREIKAAELK